MGSVTEAWVRLEGWSERHTPTSAALLAPSVTVDAISRAEAELEMTLPAELIESLRRHNGVTQRTRILPKAPPLSSTDIVDQYDERMAGVARVNTHLGDVKAAVDELGHQETDHSVAPPNESGQDISA